MSFAAAVEGAADPELGSTPAFAEPVLRAWERNCSNARYGQLPQNAGPCATPPRAKLEVRDRTIQATINATTRAGFMIRFLLLQLPVRVHRGNRGTNSEVPSGLD